MRATEFITESQTAKKSKITLSTDPKWYGAEVGDYKATGPVVNIPARQLVGFEPDDKMKQPQSQANVKKIVAGLKQGDKLPPILVRRYKNGYQVLDGHHRFWAYKQLGVKSIPAQIVPASDIEETGKQDVKEGQVQRTARGLIHRAQDRYGGEPSTQPYRNRGALARDLESLDIATTRRLERSLGVDFPDLRKNRSRPDTVNEFAPPDSDDGDDGDDPKGIPPFTVYVGLDKQETGAFITFDEALDEVKQRRRDDPREYNDYWKIENGLGETVWEHDPGDAIDVQRRDKKIGVRKPGDGDIKEGSLTEFAPPRSNDGGDYEKPWEHEIEFVGDGRAIWTGGKSGGYKSPFPKGEKFAGKLYVLWYKNPVQIIYQLKSLEDREKRYYNNYNTRYAGNYSHLKYDTAGVQYRLITDLKKDSVVKFVKDLEDNPNQVDRRVQVQFEEMVYYPMNWITEIIKRDGDGRNFVEKRQGLTEGSEDYNGIQLSLEVEKDDEYVDDEDTDNQAIYVKATANGRELGHVLFTIDYDSQGMVLNPQDLEVDPRYRGQGIAATMYDYVKSKGYRIRRSGQQTDAGAGFWKKHKPGKNIWEQGVAEGTEPRVVAARYIDEYGDGQHWYVKGPPAVIQRFVQLANSLEDEAVTGTEYEPGRGVMAGIHQALGKTDTPKWEIVPAENLEDLKPIGNRVLQKLTTPDLSDGVEEFMSDLLWGLEEQGRALVVDEPGGDLNEGQVVPFKKVAGPDWRDIPQEVRNLIVDWFFYDPVHGTKSGTERKQQFTAAQIYNRGWKLELEQDMLGPAYSDIIAVNVKTGRKIKLPVKNIYSRSGWAKINLPLL